VNTSFRRLGRNTLIYSAGVLVHRVISILMLPVYTRVMTPADYGVIDLIQMVTDVVALMLTAGLTAGVQRFYFQARTDEDRRAIVSTAFLLQMGMALVGTVLLLALAEPISRIALGGAGSPQLLRIAALNFSLGMLSSVPLLLLQTEERARLFLGVTVAKLLLQLTFNLLFLVRFRLGAEGLLLSTLVTSVVIGGWTSIWMIRRTGLAFSRRWVADLRRFGTPIQIAWAASFLLTFGDRFFLQAARGAASVGLYGMAYQFGFILQQVAGMPFIQAWRPQRFQLVGAPREKRDAANEQGFFYLSVVLVTGATATCLFVEPFLRVMTTSGFFGAAHMVPLIVLAYVIEVWAQAVTFGIEVSERTRYSAFANWISAAVALALYALLIRPLGGYGAALGTLGGFLVRLVLLHHWSQRLWPVRYGWRRPLALLALGALATAAYLVLLPGTVPRQAALAAALFAGYLGAAWALVLHADERRVLARAVRDVRHARQILVGGG
jgi:O-antigen/teichoic acid export membrane protein